MNCLLLRLCQNIKICQQIFELFGSEIGVENSINFYFNCLGKLYFDKSLLDILNEIESR